MVNPLAQKPWHPLNYRNQMKVFEAQQKAESDAKAKAIGKVLKMEGLSCIGSFHGCCTVDQ